MKLSILHIINNKLHNFEYLNYTIIFYIIVLYTYYSLFVYLLNKNYIILLLYFTFFILVYNSYKNFTYIIGLVILITFKIFNIDTRLNSNSINLINTFTNVKVENYDIMNKIKKETDIRISKLKADIDSDDNVPPANPAKSYIVDAVQRAGLNISSNQFNYKNQEKEVESKLNNMLAGHYDVKPPANISFNRSV
jgi:hypothetical protein